MRRLIVTTLLSFNLILLFSQETIKEANIELTLPNDKWALVDNRATNNLEIYIFKREPIKDSINRQVVANISVIVESISKKTDAVTYSMLKRSQVQFNVEEVFIHENGILDYKEAIGYKGNYEDEIGLHKIYVVHAVNKKKGIQFIFDVTDEIFSQIDDEFLFTLKSIKKIEK